MDEGRTRTRIPRAALGVRTARSADNSPIHGPSSSVKSDIQKLVGKALKPYYRRDYVSKDEYTDINRTVSRMLYERAGDAETLEVAAKARLAAAAKDEVKKAITSLKKQKEDQTGAVESDAADDDTVE